MVNPENIVARICENSRCVFNFTEGLETPTDLNCLIDQLENAKLKVNEYLTGLVERQIENEIQEDKLSSDSECSLPEDSDINPKRSKLVD